MNDIINEKFKKISPKKYAQTLKTEYRKNPAKWYESITPATVADEFIKQTGNDYSKIWHEHCDECYSPIDASSEECYVSDDGFCWLCAKCAIASGVVESWQLYYQRHRKKMQKIVPVYFVG